MKKPDHISHSQIQLGRCLYRYQQMKIEKKYKDENIPMKLGGLVHHVIYTYSKECIENKLEADYDLMSEIIEKEFSESGLPEEYYQQVRISCLKFGEHGFDYNTLLDYERRFRMDLGKDMVGNLILIDGIIDRVNCYDTPNGACLDIIDYKNQINILTATDVRDHQQLNMYRYALLMHLYRNEGFYLSRTGIYFTRYDFIRWAGRMVHVNELSEELESIEMGLIRQWNRLILSKEYLPERGNWCFQYSGCPVMLAGQCPLWTEKEMEQMRSNKIVSDKIRLLRVQKFSQKVLLSEVKELVDIGDDNFEVDGDMVGFEANKSYKYKLDEFYNFVADKGADLSDLMLTKTDAEKVVKRMKKEKLLEEKDLEMIEGMKVETATNKFVY